MKKLEIWDPYKEFQKITLENGLDVYYAHWNRPWLRTHVCVHSGSLNDPKGKEGTAHFVEHMISEHSGKLSASQIAKIAKCMGGSVDFGSTDPFRTAFEFEISLDRKAVATMLERFSEMILGSLDQKFFSREKNVVLNEYLKYFPLREKYDMDVAQYKEAYFGTRFENFKLSIGNPEAIKKITMQDLVDFTDKYYVPANISIIAVGGYECNEFFEIVQSSPFSQMKTGTRVAMPSIANSVPYPEVNENTILLSKTYPGLKVEVSALEQCAMIPGSFSQKVISILRSVVTTILFKEIREKTGSTYRPEINWDFIGDVYSFRVQILLSESMLKQLKGEVLYRALESAKKKRLFQEKRRYFIRSFLIEDINMEKFCDNAQTKVVKYGRIVNLQEDLELFQKASYEEYLRLIDYLLDKKRWWTRTCLL